MTRTRTVITAATITTCLAAALIAMGLATRPSHRLAISHVDSFVAIISGLNDTFAIRQRSNESITFQNLEMNPDEPEIISTINSFPTEFNLELIGKLKSDITASALDAKGFFDVNQSSYPFATRFSAYERFAIQLTKFVLPTEPVNSYALGMMSGGYPLDFTSSDPFASEPEADVLFADLSPALVNTPSARDTIVASSDAFAKPSQRESTNGDMFIPKSAAARTSIVKLPSDASPAKPATIAPLTPRTNSPTSISTTVMESKWQYWQYCLAPSHAEHKIYLSPPVPLRGYLNGADSEFNQVLTKAGLTHDSVQCPRAPNKPTLLFRQKYSIAFNKDIGNTIIDVKWDD